MDVIKRDGRKEVFSAAKIIKSIEKAAKDAKIDALKLVKEIAEPAIEYFKKKKIVKTADIRKLILEKFKKTSKDLVRAWEMYEGKKTKN